MLSLMILSLCMSACQVAGQNDEPGEPGTFDTIVQGQVTTSEGLPIDEAHIFSRLFFRSCNDTTGTGGLPDYSEEGAFTGSDGRYSLRFEHPVEEPVRCVYIRVDQPPRIEGPEGDVDTTVYPEVELRPIGEPLDTTRVDVVMQP